MELRPTRTFRVEPTLPDRLQGLTTLSRNLWWSWSSDASALFERLSPALWRETGHNPVRLLQLLEGDDLARLASDDGLVSELERIVGRYEDYCSRPAQLHVANTSEREVIAYFSFEFALTESLATYSGGLGVLSGDHLKSASDLGLPLVGVSLFYREGYFQQLLTADGSQQEAYQRLDPASHPLSPVRTESGGQLVISVPFEGREVFAAVWRVDVGEVRLFLLDTEIPQNSPGDQGLAKHLYGGDNETRIQQEMLVGIGGVRALAALGLEPAAWHMNEGHSSLLAVERIRMLMERHGLSFEEARIPVAAATVFTTHTAVAAGIDLFPPDLVQRHLGHYYRGLGLDDHAFLGLGRMDPNNDGEPFSMALLGLRLSKFRNGVSKLHGGVSRRLWAGAWPNIQSDAVPIGSITNGVHLATWVSHEMGGLFDRSVGPHWRDDPVSGVDWSVLHAVPDEDLWRTHSAQRERLVLRARQQRRESAVRLGAGAAQPALDGKVLTIGFARRFAAYKRATLLFRDVERLARIVNNPERPIQFIFAGKAHPRDEPAKQLIREVVRHSAMPEFRDRMTVLERYDVDLARTLVQGCDAWLNTPVRPMEASGTSGMKAVANGALHISVLDGWWAEAYQPGLGWAIGSEHVEPDPEAQDANDAESLYSLLEHEVAPAFYDVDGEGIPRAWVARMKASIAAFAPAFSTHRMVHDYATEAYAPAAAAWADLRRDDLQPTRALSEWLGRVRGAWGTLKVLAVDDDGGDDVGPGRSLSVTVQAHWDGLLDSDLRVELIHGAVDAEGRLAAGGSMRMELEAAGEDGICRYRASFTPHAGRAGYAVRVTPDHPDLVEPADTGLVLWA